MGERVLDKRERIETYGKLSLVDGWDCQSVEGLAVEGSGRLVRSFVPTLVGSRTRRQKQSSRQQFH